MSRQTSRTSKGLLKRQAPRPKLRQLHRHGCLQCGHVYTDSCQLGHENARCQNCRTVYPRPLWESDLDPRPCCRTKSKPARFDQLEQYALGGDTEWWICMACARTSPYNPAGANP